MKTLNDWFRENEYLLSKEVYKEDLEPLWEEAYKQGFNEGWRQGVEYCISKEQDFNEKWEDMF